MIICVTGSGGFIGSKVVQKLRSQGHEVTEFDITKGNNLLNYDEVETYVKFSEVVFHIAAEADLTKMTTLEGAENGFNNNVIATHNVAKACAKWNKWLIYASTVCVYGNQEHHPETEDTTLPNPSELYACTKYAGEWIVKGYSKNFGNPFTILRFATIYGEGMRPALGMHIFFRQAIKGEPITVHGDGLQDRTLTYIHDLVDGIVAPLKNQENAKGQIFNLSTNLPVSALKMAEDVKEVTGSQSPIVLIPQRDNQTFHEDFDVSKAEKLLGWKANTEWKDGLIKTYNWIKNNV